MLNVFEMPLFSLIFRWQPRFRLVKHVYYSLAFSYIIRICISYTHECRVCGIRVHLKWISPMYSASQAVCNQIYRCVDIMSHCHGTLPVCRTPAIHCCIARNMCTLTVARYTRSIRYAYKAHPKYRPTLYSFANPRRRCEKREPTKKKSNKLKKK